MKHKVSHHQIAVKRNWLDRAIATAKFHVECCKKDHKWNLRETAKVLERSVGSVSQDILVISWLKTHPDEIRAFKNLNDALDFIRRKKKSMQNDISHLD